MADQQVHLQKQLLDACAEGSPLRIIGGNSRPFLPTCSALATLKLDQHSGILEYQPEERVITLRSGTTLQELNQHLQQHRQQLPFEPPQFSPHSTIGGAIATALTGPGRPWRGGVRDTLLGVKVLTGNGSILQLGGSVVKNVAGYDLFRPMAGAYGSLGVLLELSIKTVPMDELQSYWSTTLEIEESLQRMQQINLNNLPLTGMSWADGALHVRLSASREELMACHQKMESLNLSDQTSSSTEHTFWAQLHHQQHPLFKRTDPLWRVSLPPASPLLDDLEHSKGTATILDWGGAQRWLSTTARAEQLRSQAESAGGHAMLYRNPLAGVERFHPLSTPLQLIHQQLRRLMDPCSILNPGLFSEPLYQDEA